MSLELSKDEVEDIIPSIKRYIFEEFDQEIGDLKAKLFLDYILKEIAPYAYNKGVKDSEAYFVSKLDDLRGSCYESEMNYWNEEDRKSR